LSERRSEPIIETLLLLHRHKARIRLSKKPNTIIAIWIPLRGTQDGASGQQCNDYGMVF
jgi:hypothetical protein